MVTEYVWFMGQIKFYKSQISFCCIRSSPDRYSSFTVYGDSEYSWVSVAEGSTEMALFFSNL